MKKILSLSKQQNLSWEYLEKNSSENIGSWLKKCYYFFVKKKTNLIFYFSPDIYFLSHQEKIPFISLIHDVMTITLKEYTFNPFKKYQEKKKLIQNKSAIRIITVSEFSKSRISQKLSIPTDKIRVIYNGIKNYTKTNKYKLKFEKYILYVGDLRKRKNVLKLVLAYLSLDIDLTNEYKLYLTGEGKLREKIIKKAKEKKLESRIKFFGKIQNSALETLYRQANLFVYPSLEEGFGLPIIEAQRHKLAVICGRHSSLKEIAGENKKSVLYANVNSIRDLKNKITWLLKDETLRKKIQKNGYQNSLQFSTNNMMLKYRKLFKEIFSSQKCLG